MGEFLSFHHRPHIKFIFFNSFSLNYSMYKMVVLTLVWIDNSIYSGISFQEQCLMKAGMNCMVVRRIDFQRDTHLLWWDSHSNSRGYKTITRDSMTLSEELYKTSRIDDFLPYSFILFLMKNFILQSLKHLETFLVSFFFFNIFGSLPLVPLLLS